MQLAAPETATYSAEQTPFTVPVTNSSGGPLSSEQDHFLSYHLLDEDGKVLRWDTLRTPLEPLPDGETATVGMIVHPVPQPGVYLLEVDVVHERVAWMKQKNGKTVAVRLVVP